MGKLKEVKIDRFDGGISADPRDSVANQFAISRHFDIFKRANALIPYRDFDDIGAGFLPYDSLWSGTTNKYYFAGRKSSTDGTKISEMSDPLTTTVAASTSAESDTKIFHGSFIEFKAETGVTRLIGWHDSEVGSGLVGQAWYYIIDGVASAFGTFTALSESSSGIAPAMISSKDGNLYMPHGYKIAKIAKADFAWSENVFSIPQNYLISSICEYGSYMLIAARPRNTDALQTSKVFVWDYASANPTDVYDAGDGQIKIIENLAGTVIAVSDKYLPFNFGISKPAMVVSYFNVSAFVPIREVFGEYNSSYPGYVKQNKIVKGNRLYWPARVPTASSGANYDEGIWVCGKNSKGQWVVTLDTVVPSSNGIDGFGNYGEYWFIAVNSDGTIKRTGETATYTATSSYESQVFDGGDRTKPKNLVNASISHDPLTSGQTITLKYRKNGASSWTTYLTSSTVGAVSKYNADSFDFNEIQWRVESTGGAQPTSYKFIFEELEDSN